MNALYVQSKSDTLEANITNSSKWQYPQSFYTYCNGPTSLDCPLSKVPTIDFNLLNTAIVLYANGVNIGKEYFPTKGQLTMYQAWNGCYDEKLCTIDIVGVSNAASTPIGNLIVDMDNGMIITKINTYPGTDYLITKEDDFTLTIKKINYFHVH